MPLTILVADDDLGTRLAVSDYLELAGYSVVMAEDGKQALAQVDQFQPHLVVTDVLMPQMDGYELVRQVRLKPALRLLPVIFLTARTNTEERIRGYQLGCDAYLPKPFELPELGAVIRNLLERSQLIQSEWRLHAPPANTQSDSQSDTQPRADDGTAANSRPHKTHAIARANNLDLTPREQGVLSFLTNGLSNNQIGDRLHLSSRTVEKYVSSLLRKTNTSNRAELVRFAMDHHLIE